MNYETKMVHISTIKIGDTIRHNGELVTICKNNITKGFCGIAIFGDSYRAGTKKVEKVIVKKSVPAR